MELSFVHCVIKINFQNLISWVVVLFFASQQETLQHGSSWEILEKLANWIIFNKIQLYGFFVTKVTSNNPHLIV